MADPAAAPEPLAERLAACSGLNAVLDWSREALAREQALALASAPAGAPLAGLPVAVKDNIVTATQPTTCASRILVGFTSPFDATAVTRLRAAGAFVAAKTNLDEFAMGSSTENSAFGRVRHPLDPDRVPGGSSGGSAALVAAGVVPAALGTETGGSVRQPAAFCGVVGLKPSYGRVSRSGVIAFGSSLDCVAVFADTVDRSAQVLAAIAGVDPADPTTEDRPPLRWNGAPRALHGLTVGLPEEYFPGDLDPGIRRAVHRAADRLRDLGALVRTVSLPHTRYAVPAYYVIAPAEAAANLARYDGVRYGLRLPASDAAAGVNLRGLYRATRGAGFGPEVRRRILLGTHVLSRGYAEAYYGRAQAMRRRITADFHRVFGAGVDLLVTPTTPTIAFRAGERTRDPVAMYLADIFTCAVSLAGLPGLSLPAGRCRNLPVGVQLIAPRFGEARLLEAAGALERVIEPHAEVHG